MNIMDKRTQKIRERIHLEIKRVLAEKNQEKPNLVNTDNKPYKNYWLTESIIVYFP